MMRMMKTLNTQRRDAIQLILTLSSKIELKLVKTLISRIKYSIEIFWKYLTRKRRQ